MKLRGIFKTGLHEQGSAKGHDLEEQRYYWRGMPIGFSWVCLNCGKEFENWQDLPVCQKRGAYTNDVDPDTQT